jgi:prevent-host-death family protein
MELSTSEAVAANEVQENFALVLQRVVGGQEVTVTDHGVPVARIIPVRPANSVENKRLAFQKMDEIAARCRLNGLRIRDLIDEGRR